MKIGITGASGLIGKAITQLVIQSGHEVVAFSRSPARSTTGVESRLIQPHAEVPLDPSGLDCLIHLAGESILGLWTEAKKKRIRDSRVDLTSRIARTLAQRQDRPTTLICASGVGFYGNTGDQWVDESSPAGTDFLANVCVEWEGATRPASEAGVRTVFLRTGLVLSNEGGSFSLMKRAFQWCAGGRLGNGRQFMPWIHIADEAGLALWAATNPSVVGPINLVAPEPVTNAEFTRLLAGKLHRPAIAHAPAWVLRTALGGLGDMLVSSQRAKPAAAQVGGYRFQFDTLPQALDDLLP